MIGAQELVGEELMELEEITRDRYEQFEEEWEMETPADKSVFFKDIMFLRRF